MPDVTNFTREVYTGLVEALRSYQDELVKLLEELDNGDHQTGL